VRTNAAFEKWMPHNEKSSVSGKGEHMYDASTVDVIAPDMFGD
jgi:hypothetical protein